MKTITIDIVPLRLIPLLVEELSSIGKLTISRTEDSEVSGKFFRVDLEFKDDPAEAVERRVRQWLDAATGVAVDPLYGQPRVS